ncbi:MAG: hypothetical protein D084_Lepto4C00273G0004 [Leptospirillum sp. Group IV 'UBA BS']|nr:MAG: hypothetical protein D084_Lepto4C00273G0004 [Leptospirillum sp. Group IV 'UBA BS']
MRTETGMIMLRNCGKIIARRRKTVSTESPLLTRRFMIMRACWVRRRITRTNRLRKNGVRSSRKRYLWMIFIVDPGSENVNSSRKSYHKIRLLLQGLLPAE